MEPVTAKLLIDLYQYDFGFRKLMVYACVGKNPDLYSQSEKKLFGNLPSCKFSSSNATVTLSFASRSVFRESCGKT